jgi:hypothetical protein
LEKNKQQAENIFYAEYEARWIQDKRRSAIFRWQLTNRHHPAT